MNHRIATTAAFALLIGPLAGRLAQAAPPAPAAAPIAAAPVHDTIVVDARTEEVIKAALRYLAAKQGPNGAWASPDGEHPLAVTAYTVMAFLASGNLPNEGEYGRNVQKGAQFLLSCARDDGFFTSDLPQAGRRHSNMYDHGIATIALAELYGQAQDPKVKSRLEAAVKLIVSCQNQQGGWRYEPRPSDADISVTVLQVVALRAIKNGGLDVPQKTIDRAVAYVKTCRDANSGGFCYQPNSGPGFARTAAAIYSLQVCGLYSDPMVAKGSEFLVNQRRQEEWFTYGQFYAAPAQYMIGGSVWKDWYPAINEFLLKRVISPPGDKTIAYWDTVDGNTRGVGPIYATAVYTTMLSMPYHYIPLYQR
jgi:hypothetical protein